MNPWYCSTWDQKLWAVSKNEIGPHACHCEMSPSRVGKRDHHMWSVVKPWEPRLKRDLQGRTERTLAVRTLSDSCFVDIETGVGWWGLSDSICLLLYEFSTFIPLITDDINQLSFLTWSTSMYRVLRDLPTFGHIPNKSRSLGDIGKVACSVTPSATCPLNVSLRYPWKIPQQNSHVLFCHSPSRHLQRLGVASSFTRAYYFWHALYSTTWSPNRLVAQSLPHLGVLDITFSDEPVVLLVCNMRSKALGGLQKWDRSSCVSLWNVAIQGWKTRSSHVKCCQTLRTEIETRSSRADRTNFGSEDIEWFLFCWHRNRCRLMRIIGFHMPSFVWVFNIHPPDHRWHQPVVFFDMVDVDVQGSPWSAYLWSHTK